MTGRIKPYFGVGLSNVNVKMDLLDSVSFNDLIDVAYYFDYYYPYELLEIDEAIEITKVGFTQESESVWGFHAKVGVNFELAKNISIFGEARYLSANIEFERPDITFKCDATIDYYFWVYGYEEEWTEMYTVEEEFDIDDTVEIKVGGVQAILGIKFSF